MTIQELITKYNGKPCKVLPNNLSPQCFDLAVAWTDSLGIPHFPNNLSPFPYANASQIFTDFGSFQGQYFTKIANTPDGVPQAGDLVVWASSYNNGAGHVAIATGSGDTNHFQAFEQNDPNPYCQLKDYSYNSVLGWLRPNSLPTTPTPPTDDCPAKLVQITAERDRLNGVIADKDTTIAHLGDTINGKNAEIATLNTTISNLNSQVLTLTDSLATATEQAKKVPQLTDDLANCEASRTGCQGDLSKCKTLVGKIKSQLIPKKYLSLKIYNLLMSLE